MRSAVALAGLLLLAPAAQAQNTRLPAPRVLLLDRSALKSAGSSDVPEDIRRTAADILQGLVKAYGANIVLDRSATVAPNSAIDITGRVLVALEAARPDWVPANPELPSPINAAMRAYILVVDLENLHSPIDGRALGTDPANLQALRDLASSHGASFIVNRKAVVIATHGFDVTMQAAAYLEAVRASDAASQFEKVPLALPARIVVLDRSALLKTSLVGIDIATQIQAITKDTEDALRPENDSLTKERELLEGQLALLSDEEKMQRLADLEGREAAFRQKVQQRQNQIKAAVAVAQRQVEAAAGPIAMDIVKSYGANMMLDRQAIVFCNSELDVTRVAVQKLNAVLPHVAVVLQSPPENAASPPP
jgi:Skp family chaperone for outer membrane proteins